MKKKKKKWKSHNEWKIGIKQKRKKAEAVDRDYFKKLIDSGYSSPKISELINVSTPTVIKYSRELLGFDYYLKLKNNGKNNVRVARQLRMKNENS